MWPFRRKPRWRIEVSPGGILDVWEAVIHDERHYTLWVVGAATEDDALEKAGEYVTLVEQRERTKREAKVYYAEEAKP
jgi:hypothetical protein